MRIITLATGLAVLLCACAYPTRIPEALRTRPDRTLLTVSEGSVITCRQNRTTWDVQFSSSTLKYLCLVPTRFEKQEADPGYEVKARIPSGSEYIVKKAISWSGVDAGGYVFEVLIPAFSKDNTVLVTSLDTVDLFGVHTEPKSPRK